MLGNKRARCDNFKSAFGQRLIQFEKRVLICTVSVNNQGNRFLSAAVQLPQLLSKKYERE